MKALPPVLERVCRNLETGDLAGVRGDLELARARLEECAELSVLEQVVRRRLAAPSDAWLNDFIEAWVDAGRPTDFRFIGGPSRVELVERLVAGVVNAPHLGLDVAVFMRNHGRVSPLVLLLSVAAEPGRADDCVRQALAEAAAPGDKTLLDKLWVAALLDARADAPAVADRAREVVSRLWAEMAEARPWDFTFTATAVLLDGRLDSAPLTREQLVALRDAAARHREHLDAGDLYDELVRSRSARRPEERRACSIDTSLLLPNPLVGICLRARPLLAAGSEHDREELASVLEVCARIFTDARDAPRRLVALAARKFAAEASGDVERVHAANADHQLAARVAAAQHRFPLAWPIEALQLEAIDASAHDEWGLFERTAFPASSEN